MEVSSNTKILIAGGNGFIGNYISKYLQDKYEICSIGYEEYSSYNYCKVDLTQLEEVIKYVKSLPVVGTLIFLTGLAHSKGKNKDYQEFYNINVNTLINLLTTLKDYNKLPSKIIFASTISVYGENWKRETYDEKIRLSPKSPYARTKMEAEKYLLENYKNNSWILRFSPVYADNFMLNIDRRTIIKNKFYCVGDGKAKLSLLNIQNIKKVIHSIIENKVPSGVYNLADKKTYNYLDLLEFQNAEKIIHIPKFIMYLLYKLGQLIRINYLIENSIKLSTNNIFIPDKIHKFINLDKELRNVK
jgi:UDP-glucose 4-epimerase